MFVAQTCLQFKASEKRKHCVPSRSDYGNLSPGFHSCYSQQQSGGLYKHKQEARGKWPLRSHDLDRKRDPADPLWHHLELPRSGKVSMITTVICMCCIMVALSLFFSLPDIMLKSLDGTGRWVIVVYHKNHNRICDCISTSMPPFCRGPRVIFVNFSTQDN